MAKRTRAPAWRGRAKLPAQRRRKIARKAAVRTTRKPKSKSAAAKTRHASLARRWTYTPELLAYARQRFEQTASSLAEIGLDVGISKETVRVLAEQEGWKRYERPPHGLPPATRLLMQAETSGHLKHERPDTDGDRLVSLPQGEGDIPSLSDTIVRLHRIVLDELAAIETACAQPHSASSSARNARSLASLTETLQKLQRLQPEPANHGSNDADIPANIDEFRNALARRIERFVIERTDAGDGEGCAAPVVDALR
jgi:hypothetical protein